jgi:hypothetical protein
MTTIQFVKLMLEEARREEGPDVPITKELEEELRALKATADMTSYEQFILGEHELGPEE